MVVQGQYAGWDSVATGGSNAGVVGVMDGGFADAASFSSQGGGGKRIKNLSTKRRKNKKKTTRLRRRTKGRRTKHCKCDDCRCDPCKCTKKKSKKTRKSKGRGKRKNIHSFRKSLHEDIHRGRLMKYGDITV